MFCNCGRHCVKSDELEKVRQDLKQELNEIRIHIYKIMDAQGLVTKICECKGTYVNAAGDSICREYKIEKKQTNK